MSLFSWTLSQIDGLVQERRNSIANALELHLSCINPSKCWHIFYTKKVIFRLFVPFAVTMKPEKSKITLDIKIYCDNLGNVILLSNFIIQFLCYIYNCSDIVLLNKALIGSRNLRKCHVSFRIPGQLNDRRTMLGELNWIFTAITDTVAWNTLPRGV